MGVRMKISFTLFGAPRTKKTSNRLVPVRGRQFVLPSKAWVKWRDSLTFRCAGKMLPYSSPIKEPVNCAAIFYRDALRGDAVGYYQGLADVLEYYRIVDDDKYLVSWDGSRLEKDAKNPRVEVTLESVE